MFRLVVFSKKLVANVKYRESTRKNLATQGLLASRGVAAVARGSSPQHSPRAGPGRPLASSALPSRLRSPQAWGTGRVLGFPFPVASSRCHRKGSDQARAGFVAQRRGCRRQRGPGSRASVSRGCRSRIWVPAPCPLTRGPWRVSGHWAGHTLEGLRPSGTATWQLCNYHAWPGKKKRRDTLATGSPRTPPPAPLPVSRGVFLQAHVCLAFSPCIHNGRQPFVLETCLLPHSGILSIFSPWLLRLHRRRRCHHQARQMEP